jgi:hypothetical protein
MKLCVLILSSIVLVGCPPTPNPPPADADAAPGDASYVGDASLASLMSDFRRALAETWRSGRESAHAAVKDALAEREVAVSAALAAARLARAPPPPAGPRLGPRSRPRPRRRPRWAA